MSDDPRFTDYWAAIRADLSKQTVDAVIRLADNEQAELRAEVDRLAAAATGWKRLYDAAITATVDTMHANTRAERAEAEVEGLRAALRFKSGIVEDLAAEIERLS